MKSATVLVFALAAGLVSAHDRGQRAPGIPALVEEERAFARLSGKVGQAAAFLAYFADDVVTFQPAPQTGKGALRAAAAKAVLPAPRMLDWEPWYAGVSKAGDLGFTTGPSRVTDVATGQAVYTGWYFSVWTHDRNGWRVAADVGVQAPAVEALRPHEVGGDEAAAAADAAGRSFDAVRELEEKLARGAARQGLVRAYEPYLDSATRVYRDKREPAVGEEHARAVLAGEPQWARCRVTGGSLAASGDLAYAYGACEAAAAGGGAVPGGGFLHVWRLGPGGWRLAADVVTR
jgi:ketosteroid isomerase-like protein